MKKKQARELPTPKAFIRKLSQVERSKSNREKFRDFCEMAYCAYAKLTANPDRAEALEERYMRIVNTYQDKDAVRMYPELLAMTFEAVHANQDFLGVVSAEIEVLDSRQGQFFTPYNVSLMMAQMMMADAPHFIEDKGFVSVLEPAAGAGGMVLAVANELSAQGFDPTVHMLVNAVDVSPLCFHMCYIQLTQRGIPAFVERANSLSMERFECAWTPSAILFRDHHGHLNFEHTFDRDFDQIRRERTAEVINKHLVY